MDKYVELVDNNLKKILQDIDDKNPAKEYIEYILFPGGKRLRPVLSLISYEMYSEDLEEMYALSSAIELIHNYSLVHDDLPAMDDDDYRRGKETIHKKYGEAEAILTGDSLLNLAFEISLKDIINSESTIAGDKTKALSMIARKAGINGMIFGQFLDIKNNLEDFESLNDMYIKKTSNLLTASLLSSSIVAKASLEELDLIEEFGEYFGLVFQIRDDILDYEDDIAINKQTIIRDLSRDQSISLLHDYHKLAMECLKLIKDRFSRDTRKLEEIINKLIEI